MWALVDPRRPAAGTGAPALHGRTLVRVAGGDVELVRWDVLVVGGVGDRGVEDLDHQVGGTPLGELEDRAGLADRLVADQVQHDADLGGRDAGTTVDGPDTGTLVGLEVGCGGHQRRPFAPFS
jgi:hypothetical protein